MAMRRVFGADQGSNTSTTIPTEPQYDFFGEVQLTLDEAAKRGLWLQGIEINGYKVRGYSSGASAPKRKVAFDGKVTLLGPCPGCGKDQITYACNINLSWKKLMTTISQDSDVRCTLCKRVRNGQVKSYREFVDAYDARLVEITDVFTHQGIDPKGLRVTLLREGFWVTHPNMVIADDHYWVPDWINPSLDPDALPRLNALIRALGISCKFSGGLVALSPIPMPNPKRSSDASCSNMPYNDVVKELEILEAHTEVIAQHKRQLADQPS